MKAASPYAICCLAVAMCVGCSKPQGPQPPPAASVQASAAPTVSTAAPDTSAAPATAPKSKVETLFVHEKLAECQGEGPMQCMQVRKSEGEEWTFFYQSIEGFTHEPGHRYELKVEISSVDNPPADGSTLRHKLIEVVSKQKIPAAGK